MDGRAGAKDSAIEAMERWAVTLSDTAVLIDGGVAASIAMAETITIPNGLL
ncbi:MAG: hypothetical protein ACFCBV_08295 [Phycisphaerales bacterium]